MATTEEYECESAPEIASAGPHPFSTVVWESAEQGVQYNKVAGPDIIKAQEVESMERKYMKEFPLLKKRFKYGEVFRCAEEMLNLILEVQELMMLPVRHLRRKPVVVLMGMTGSGKSTFGNWLVGKSVKKAAGEDEDDVTIVCEDAAFRIGGGRHSMTFAPNVYDTGEDVVIDFPGFADSNGFEVRIGMDLAFRTMMAWLKPAHVIALLPIDSFEAGCGTLIRQQLSKISRLLPCCGDPLSKTHQAGEEDACRWMVGVTKCDNDFVKAPQRKFNNAVKQLEDLQPLLKNGNVININHEIFGEDSATPWRLKAQIMRTKCTPLRSHPELKKTFDSCFPSKEDVKELHEGGWLRRPRKWLSEHEFDDVDDNLMSDCLNPLDTDWLENALSTYDFADLSFNKDDGALATSIVFNADESPTDWAIVKKSITDAQAQLRSLRQAIETDSETMMMKNVLGVERRSPQIHALCAHRQCRLKLVFVNVEEKTLKIQMNLIQLVKSKFSQTVDALKGRYLTEADAEVLKKQIEEIEKSFVKDVQTLGYPDLAKFVGTTAGVLGLLAGIGGVGMLGHVTATSTSLGAWLVGTGSWTSISVGATVGLTTSGVLLGVAFMGSLGYGISRKVLAKVVPGYETSKELTKLLLDGMDELAKSHSACAQHVSKLAGIKAALKTLEVLPKD